MLGDDTHCCEGSLKTGGHQGTPFWALNLFNAFLHHPLIMSDKFVTPLNRDTPAVNGDDWAYLGYICYIQGRIILSNRRRKQILAAANFWKFAICKSSTFHNFIVHRRHEDHQPE